MQQMSKTIFAGLTAAAILLAGCSSSPKEPTVQLPDRHSVPKEKWSDAMHVAEAMGLTQQRDVPREHAQGGDANAGAGAGSSSVADLGLAAGGYAAPPSGVSSGAALGLGVGLFLLGGGSTPSARFQTAAWVPTTLASSPEEASALVSKIVEEARIKAFPEKRSALKTQVAKYPANHMKTYANPVDMFNEKPVPFDGKPMKAPSFIEAEEVYGPIYVLNEQYSVDGMKNDMTIIEAMEHMSGIMPDWIYIYHPGQKLRKNSIPSRIINKGKTMYFIGK
ncbi:hypothetical protein FEV13_00315 (plasmid) [Stutzerimonas degradans]|nr:hypothetical protein FEV13_00315 [Stutzerimonas degradans]